MEQRHGALHLLLEELANEGGEGEEEYLNLNVLQHQVLELAEPLHVLGDIAERRNIPKNENFYETTIPLYMDDIFIEHFRMSRGAVEELVQAIGATNRMTTRIIPLEKKVLFSLWVLGKQESFLAVSDRFGFARSTGHYIFTEFVEGMLTLMPQYIQWPQDHREAIREFYEKSHGFPGVIGAVDGCHVPIKQPPDNGHDYYNRKQFHSIILQGLCDHSMKFIDVFVGMPGRVHDARVWRNSEIYQRMVDANNPLLPDDLHILGDSAYPLMQNLLTPFRDNGHLDAAEVNYNYKLSCIRAVIERAFGRLKGKFRRLKYLDVLDPLFGTRIITVACILHNFIIITDNDDEEFEYEEEVPDEPLDDDDGADVPLENRHAALQKRRTIVNMLQH